MTSFNRSFSAQSTPGAMITRYLTQPELRLQLIIWLTLISVAVIMALPFAWLLSSSLKLEQKIFQFPPQWIPDPIRLMNYVDAMTYKPFHIYFMNTALIAVINQVAILASASFCAYGFARIRFPGRDFWFAIVLATMMVPYFVLMVPSFIIFSRIGWIDTIP